MSGSTASFLPTNVLGNLIPTNVTNSITSFGNFIISNLPQVPQYFNSVPFPNNQPVLYKLELFSGSSVGGSNYNPVPLDTFIFPLTPSSVAKQVINLTNYFDVKGDPNNLGVQRIIDVYGLTPPIISISGTTGFQFHSLDQYQWSGRSSFARLVNMIQSYNNLVALSTNSSQVTTLPVLVFTDGYTGEVYGVVPLGTQNYAMDNNRPIYQVYDLRFLAASSVQLAAVSLAQQDPINVALLQTLVILQTTAASWWHSILNSVLPGSLV